jgi:hypothetical protein
VKSQRSISGETYPATKIAMVTAMIVNETGDDRNDGRPVVFRA